MRFAKGRQMASAQRKRWRRLTANNVNRYLSVSHALPLRYPSAESGCDSRWGRVSGCLCPTAQAAGETPGSLRCPAGACRPAYLTPPPSPGSRASRPHAAGRQRKLPVLVVFLPSCFLRASSWIVAVFRRMSAQTRGVAGSANPVRRPHAHLNTGKPVARRNAE